MYRTSRSKLFAAYGTVLAVLFTAGCGAGGSSDDSHSATIGVLSGLSGPSASVAETVVNAVNLAVKEAAGGDSDLTVEVKPYDTKATPEEAARLAQRAITVDGVSVLIASGSSAEALAIKQVAERNKVVYINASSVSPDVTADAKYTFRVAGTSTVLSKAIVSIPADLGIDSVATAYDDGAVGEGFKTLYGAAADDLGLKSTAVQYTGGASDVSDLVLTLKNGDPGAVLFGGSQNADPGLIAKTMVEQGLKVPFVGHTSIATPDAVTVAGTAYDELPGVYTVQSVNASKPEYRKFVEAYKAEFGSDEGLVDFSAQAYDAATVAIAALETGAETGDELAEALVEMDPHSGAASANDLSFATSHDGFLGEVFTTYKYEAGEFVVAEKS